METWKPFHTYQVSNFGRLKNKKGKLIKCSNDNRGYIKYNLYIDKKRKTIKVHTLVMLVFVGKRPFDKERNEYYQIDHINHNRHDNRLSNLRYCTRDENMKNRRKIIKSTKSINMNNTTTTTTECDTMECFISLAVMSSLFITSEILPFLKGQNSGLAQCLLSVFESSQCCLSKLIDTLKNEKEEQGQSTENHNLVQNESHAENTNTININVAK